LMCKDWKIQALWTAIGRNENLKKNWKKEMGYMN
jgi:hypothetical protein